MNWPKKWREIEFAPKDGSQILTWRRTYPHLLAAQGGCWYQTSLWSDQHKCFVGFPKDTQPTHWMPLPDEPK